MTTFDATHLWDRLLTCQVELTLPLELPWLYSSAAWLEATRVLDVGCGNGAHAIALSRLFPEKSFLAVDKDASLVALAESTPQPQIEWRECNLFDVEGRFPFVVARLIAQHQPSIEAFVAKTAELLLPGGLLLGVEPRDDLRLFHPEAPHIEALYRDFIAKHHESGFRRDAGVRLCELAPQYGLRVLESGGIPIPSSLPGFREKFAMFHELIFDIFERAFSVASDRSSLERDLDEWQTNPRSFAQIGVHIALLQRVES